MAVQNGLLRIVETGEMSRIGRDLPMRVTNRDLPDAVRHGRFRQYLYDCLRVFEIRVPRFANESRTLRPWQATSFETTAPKRSAILGSRTKTSARPATRRTAPVALRRGSIPRSSAANGRETSVN